jgi:cytochrome c oxidase assembly protein subunit 15
MVALGLLCAIVVTGAAVRLTGSGLGCEDWPRCNEERFIDVSSTHGAIEQVNRLFTGLVTIGVVVAVLGAIRRVPRRPDLVRLAWGLVAGVVGQIVLGGVVVLTDLHPLANQGHFVLSMVLVVNALVLVRRAGEASATRLSVVSASTGRLVRVVVVVGFVAVYTGTVVTGSGPHAGDEEARRFGFDISSVARVHGASVIVTLSLVLALVMVARRHDDWRRLDAPIETLLVVGLLQAAVGYVQYFNDIPALLVGIHIAGATGFSLALANLWLSLRSGEVVQASNEPKRATVA